MPATTTSGPAGNRTDGRSVKPVRSLLVSSCLLPHSSNVAAVVLRERRGQWMREEEDHGLGSVLFGSVQFEPRHSSRPIRTGSSTGARRRRRERDDNRAVFFRRGSGRLRSTSSFSSREKTRLPEEGDSLRSRPVARVELLVVGGCETHYASAGDWHQRPAAADRCRIPRSLLPCGSGSNAKRVKHLPCVRRERSGAACQRDVAVGHSDGGSPACHGVVDALLGSIPRCMDSIRLGRVAWKTERSLLSVPALRGRGFYSSDGYAANRNRCVRHERTSMAPGVGVSSFLAATPSPATAGAIPARIKGYKRGPSERKIAAGATAVFVDKRARRVRKPFVQSG
jgi:hypothetical protein